MRLRARTHIRTQHARACAKLLCRPLKDTSTGLDFYGGSAEVKDWEAQGRDITAEVTCSEKYKSLALHAEVKLAEALERCARLCPDAYTSSGEGKPNKLKTAVCSQVRSSLGYCKGVRSLKLQAFGQAWAIRASRNFYCQDWKFWVVQSGCLWAFRCEVSAAGTATPPACANLLDGWECCGSLGT